MFYNVQTMTSKRVTTRICFTVCLLAVFLIFSCGPRAKGYGVLLWSPDETAQPSGSLVPIYEESAIKETYTAGIGEEKQQIEIPMWRLRYFNKKKDAAAAAERFSEYADSFAVAERDGLPIREEPNSDSPRVYRLRKGQTIKILTRTDQPFEEGGLSDYWYRVLTEDGSTGYAFGYFLDIKTAGEEGTGEETESTNPQIASFLSTVWRPEQFKSMIEENQIDLSSFSPSYGLFPQPQQNRIELVTEKRTVTFDYSDIISLEDNRYIFQDTSLKLRFINSAQVYIEYEWQGKTFTGMYVRIERDIEALREQEQLRRKKLFTMLIDKGEELSSSAYGTIRLNKEREFTWYNYQKLVPQIISPEAGNSGTLSFSLFLSEELKEQYDGVVTFHFEGVDSEKNGAHFLFRKENRGVKMVYVPKNDIKDNVVLRETSFPIVIFFTAGG